MPQPLSSKVARPAAPSNDVVATARPLPPRASRLWSPAAVADRLLRQHGARLAGERALARRQRLVRLVDGVPYVTHPFRWLYWDCVLIVVERQTHLRFRHRRHAVGAA